MDDLIHIILPLAAAAVLAVLRALTYRKENVDKTPRSLPPADISPAQAGYILTGNFGETDVTGLLFTLLAGGCLSVSQTNKELRFSARRAPGPAEGRLADIYFDALFGADGVRRQPGESVCLPTAGKRLGEGYDRIYKDMQQEYKNQHKLYTDQSVMIMRLCYLVCFGVSFVFMLVRQIGSGDQSTQDVFFSILMSLVFSGMPLLFLMVRTAASAREDVKEHRSFTIAPLLLFGGAALFYCLIVLFLDSLPAAAAWMVFFIAMPFILRGGKQHTSYGEKVYGEICGLRNFIAAPDAAQLREQQEADKMYFYRMFAYAFVFGLENAWCGHFDGMTVPAPAFYTSPVNGSYDYRQMAEIAGAVNEPIHACVIRQSRHYHMSAD